MTSYHYVDILVNVVLAIIMFSLGLSFTFQEFKHVIIYPKPIIIGLAIQIFIIPLIAYFIALFAGLIPEQKVGIILVSVCASGASSNLITHLVRGNVPLAVTMTTLNSFITLVTLPVTLSIAIFLFLGEQTRIELPIAQTILQIFMVAIVPASIGVLVRNFSPHFANTVERPLKFILPVMLFLVFAFKIFAEKNHGGSGITFSDTINIFPYVFLLNIFAMVAGLLISKLMRLDFRNQYTIAIEVGLHNTALALLVAGTILFNHEMEKPALVYAMFTFFSAILFIFAIKGKSTFRD